MLSQFIRSFSKSLPKQLWVFFALLFFGFLIFLHSRDPFRRTMFTLKTKDGLHTHGISMLPVGFQKGPIVIYIHGAGGSWLIDGNDLRQFAEMGMAVVDFDYDQDNADRFDEEFSAILEYTHRQSWGSTNVAWVSFSLGSQNTLRYLLRHADYRPQLYVRLAGGPVSNMEEMASLPKPWPPVLVVQGQNDGFFSAEDAERVVKFLRSKQTSVTLRILPGHGHAFENDRPVVLRLIAEYCKAKLTPRHPWPEFHELNSHSLLFCISPAILWIGLILYWKSKVMPLLKRRAEFTKFNTGLWVAVILLATLAIGDSALHFVLPYMAVDQRTLSIARRYLIAPKLHQDFDALVALPVWQGRKLGVLLDHVDLANYVVFELVNWKLPNDLYRQFVLSPIIRGDERELNWRRELWEDFWPRVRHENSTSDAADIIVRFLRQRVTIAPTYPKHLGVESMWNSQIVNVSDFEILYVAALRSVGVPARLNGEQKVIFWTGSEWRPAPRPLATTWVE